MTYLYSVHYTPLPQSFFLIGHSSEAKFLPSDHPLTCIVSQSDESDLRWLTIRSMLDVSDVIR